MKRLFYFTGYRLIVFHWERRRLADVFSFEPTLIDLNRFKEYLKQSVSIPAKLLVDVIEEDFRIESVPHVGAKDRKAVISRLIDRYYRSSQQYCYHEVIGRKKDGRKDDMVLIGAMTNPMLIQPWMTVIDECKIPLSGIWTLPLVSRELLKVLDAGKGVTLLVSQAVRSNVRQSLFRNGKLLSSRQSVINQEITGADKIARHIGGEVDKTLAFLRNQEMLEFDERVNLHIIGNDNQLDSLEQVFRSDERQTVTLHTIKNIVQKLKISGVDEEFSDGVFSWLCLNQKLQPSHYGDTNLFRRYFSSLASSALYVASIAILVTGFLLTEANISTALGDKEAIRLVNEEAQEYRDIYAEKFEAYEAVFKNASVMNSAVKLAERIKSNSKTSPLAFMLHLSNVLDQDGMPHVHIDRIEWWAVNTDKESRVIDSEGVTRTVNFTAATEVFHQAVIAGRINAAEYNYRESIDQIENIVSVLSADPLIETVEVVSMPVDLRPGSKFSAESGLETGTGKIQELSGVFKLKLVMRNQERG